MNNANLPKEEAPQASNIWKEAILHERREIGPRSAPHILAHSDVFLRLLDGQIQQFAEMAGDNEAVDSISTEMHIHDFYEQIQKIVADGFPSASSEDLLKFMREVCTKLTLCLALAKKQIPPKSFDPVNSGLISVMTLFPRKQLQQLASGSVFVGVVEK